VRGGFSILEELTKKPPAVEGRVVLAEQGQPRFRSPSIQIPGGLGQQAEQPFPILWSRHSSARLVGSGLALVNSRGQAAVESVYGASRLAADPCHAYVPVRPPKRLAGRWTSVISKWSPADSPTNYAHWLLDALPRLAVLEEFPADTGILVPEVLQGFQRETIEWLGLGSRIRPTRETHLVVEDYFFSSPTAMIVCYNPYAVRYLRQRLLPHASLRPAAAKRFFLRRKGLFRNIANEAAVLDFFGRLGWTVVDTAGMRLADQIRLFAGAEAVCGAHGAGLVNAVWCQPGCQVIEIFAETYLSGCYEWLCECVEARHSFLIFPADHGFNAWVDLSRLREHLEKLALI
jgi:hypothetical protein